jgi:hypothetical protein
MLVCVTAGVCIPVVVPVALRGAWTQAGLLLAASPGRFVSVAGLHVHVMRRDVFMTLRVHVRVCVWWVCGQRLEVCQILLCFEGQLASSFCPC